MRPWDKPGHGQACHKINEVFIRERGLASNSPVYVFAVSQDVCAKEV